MVVAAVPFGAAWAERYQGAAGEGCWRRQAKPFFCHRQPGFSGQVAGELVVRRPLEQDPVEAEVLPEGAALGIGIGHHQAWDPAEGLDVGLWQLLARGEKDQVEALPGRERGEGGEPALSEPMVEGNAAAAEGGRS